MTASSDQAAAELAILCQQMASLLEQRKENEQATVQLQQEKIAISAEIARLQQEIDERNAAIREQNQASLQRPMLNQTPLPVSQMASSLLGLPVIVTCQRASEPLIATVWVPPTVENIDLNQALSSTPRSLSAGRDQDLIASGLEERQKLWRREYKYKRIKPTLKPKKKVSQNDQEPIIKKSDVIQRMERFFKTLVNLSRTPERLQTPASVKINELVQAVLAETVLPETFISNLSELVPPEMRSVLHTILHNHIPIFKQTIPLLRDALNKGEMVIEGVSMSPPSPPKFEPSDSQVKKYLAYLHELSKKIGDQNEQTTAKQFGLGAIETVASNVKEPSPRGKMTASLGVFESLMEQETSMAVRLSVNSSIADSNSIVTGDEVSSSNASPQPISYPAKRQYRCPHCAEVFPNWYRFHSHVYTAHAEQNNALTCKECGKKFANKYSLKQHGVVHSGAKPFKCHFCDSYFAYKKTCTNHEKKIHPEVISQEVAAPSQ